MCPQVFQGANASVPVSTPFSTSSLPFNVCGRVDGPAATFPLGIALTLCVEVTVVSEVGNVGTVSFDARLDAVWPSGGSEELWAKTVLGQGIDCTLQV